MSSRFERVCGDLHVLRVPFGNVWTAVVLAGSKEGGCVLIDSANCAERVDDTIVPALEKMGLSLSDVRYLLCTHTHGDHVGGHRRIKELCNSVKVLCTEEQLPKLRDPLKYSKLIRSVFPEHSPEAPADLRGTEPDGIIKNGETVFDRFTLVKTPGHDTDTVCFHDTVTKTVICGDSLQANGTVSQGIGLYMELAPYQKSIEAIDALCAENLLLGHSYDPIGDMALGKSEVKKCLDICRETVSTYDRVIAECDEGGMDAVETARALTKAVNAYLPDFLFLPLYTVTAHLKELKK
jgi:glyoxylase-like metal-dependent hydrolase (beta-lactamase superfamily II)